MDTPGYIWFDAEFSSLELEKASLLQVAAIITNTELEPFQGKENYIELIINLDERNHISPWVNDNLNNLVERCFSPEALDIKEADIVLTKWVQNFFGKPPEDFDKRPILAGNSVHNDWFMIRKFLPKFNDNIHYRLLDVSSFKIGWNNWLHKKESFNKDDLDLINSFYPGKPIEQLKPHDALFDIKASIAELSFYKQNIR